MQATPQDVSGLLRGLKSLVERGSSEAAAILAQVLAHLAADDSDAQVSTTAAASKNQHLDICQWVH